MRYALSVPAFFQLSNVRFLVEIAREAEQAGWDAFFLWDHMLFDGSASHIADPWVALTAIACGTTTLKLGTMLTPIPRRRPWKLARETTTLDRLSGGRLILGVGLGFPPQVEYGRFHEESEDRILAEKLDEGLEILTGLWSGQPFRFAGKHYQLEEMTFQPTPLQSPRIPIWVGGMWPNKSPMRRAAKWDGVFPIAKEGSLAPADLAAIQAYLQPYRTSSAPFTVVASGITPGDDPQKAAEIVESYASVGVNWWIEDVSPYNYGWNPSVWTDENILRMRQRIRQGPLGS